MKMKKLVKLAMGLVLLMAPMTLHAQSVSEASQLLKQYCVEKNQEVPIKDGDEDAYYVLFGFEDNQMNIVYGVSTELFAAFCNNKEEALDAVVEEFSTNEELLGIVGCLSICDGTLAFIVCDYNGDIKDENNRLMFLFDKDDINAIIAKAQGK
jgi:hypothetical protein